LHFDHCSIRHFDLDQLQFELRQGDALRFDLLMLSLEGYWTFRLVEIIGRSSFLFIFHEDEEFYFSRDD